MRKRNVPEFFYNSEEEHALLMKKANSAGMTKADYIRTLVEGSVVKEAPPADFYQLVREMRSIGNNINQLVRLANTKGFIDALNLKKAFDDLRSTENMLWQTFSRVKSGDN